MRKARAKGKLWIGTSGWSYDWGTFYPAELPAGRRLAFYSTRFGSAEANYSFYRLPREATYAKWRDETPDDFVFALKLSRYVTHIKRLKGAAGPLKVFLARAMALGRKRGPILVQLPPGFRVDAKRLSAFLATAERTKTALGLRGLRLAFEFRHPSWFEQGATRDAVLGVLKKRNAAFVFAHSAHYPYPGDEPVTADFVYVRFHGPKALFASRYGPAALRSWAGKIRRWRLRGLDVHAYFNNDVAGYAVEDAATLARLLGRGGK